MKKLPYSLTVFYLIIIAVSCAGSENELPDVLIQPKENLAGIRILTRDGGHLAWSKKKITRSPSTGLEKTGTLICGS